jgi:hypothetical protein
MAEETTTSKRTAAEITRDIAAEREGLESAFDALSAELQQAADSAAEKARTAGRKALVVVPAVAATVGALIAAAALLRRRPHRDR